MSKAKAKARYKVKVVKRRQRATPVAAVPAAPAGVLVVPAAPALVLLRLDIGCGRNKQAGFLGVDRRAFAGVDRVWDVRTVPWPWDDNSVDEVYSSHFVEHLTGAERISFWNELHRVLKPGAKAAIITPNWSHECAYGDPTHQWPPMSSWAALYLNRAWRQAQAPHTDGEGLLVCDFDFISGMDFDPWLENKAQPVMMEAAAHNTNSHRNLYLTLTKRTPPA